MTACAFSPDGTRIVSASDDGTLRLWDADSGALLAVLGTGEGRVKGCAFSPDGRTIASVSADGAVRVRDAVHGAPRLALEAAGSRACAWSSDSRWIATAGPRLQLWDPATGREGARLEGGTDRTACDFSPDGGRIAATGEDMRLLVWDLERGPIAAFDVTAGWEPLAALGPHDEQGQRSTGCAFSRDGRMVLAAAGREPLILGGRTVAPGFGELRAWELESRREVLRVRVDAMARACAWSSNGRQVAGALEGGRIGLWRADDGGEVALVPADRWRVACCAFSVHGLLVTGGYEGTLKIWELAIDGAGVSEEHEPHRGANLCRFSPDGAWVATGSKDGSVVVRDAREGEEVARRTGLAAAIRACAFSAAGDLLVVGTGESDDGERRCEAVAWKVPSGEVIARRTWERSRIVACALSPSGRRAALLRRETAGSRDDVTEILDLEPGGAPSPAPSPHGRWGHRDPRLHWFYIPYTYASVDHALAPFALSPDGRVVAVSMVSEEGDVTVTVLSSGEERDRSVIGPRRDTSRRRLWTEVRGCAFSPDGRLLAWCTSVRDPRVSALPSGGELWVWDVRRGGERAVIRTLGDFFRRCAFSPDGRWVFASTDRGLFQVHDASTLEPRAAYVGGMSFVEMDVAPVGRRVAIVDEHGGLHFLAPTGFPDEPPVVTAGYRFDDSAWDSEPTARCGACGRTSAATTPVAQAIAGVVAAAGLAEDEPPSLGLPDEAWDEPGLLSSCPHCGASLRFNPFFFDLRRFA